MVTTTLPIDHITLSGGEPLLYPQLLQLTSAVKKMCGSVGITTNGRSLTPRRLVDLMSSGLTQIAVPLHSNKADVHDELAGGKSWHAAVRALTLAVEVQLLTTVSSVVTRKNVDDIKGVAELAFGLGIRSIVLNCFHATGQGKGKTELEISEEEFSRVVADVKHYTKSEADVLIGSPAIKGRGLRTAIDRVVVSPYGDIKLCNQSAGSVVDGPSDKALQDFLNTIASGSYSNYLDRIDSCTCFGLWVPETQPAAVTCRSDSDDGGA